MKVKSLNTGAYTVPTPEPESDGTLTWTETTVVTVEAHAGGWVLFYPYPDNPNLAIVGDRRESRQIELSEVVDLYAAIDELIARRFPAVPAD